MEAKQTRYRVYSEALKEKYGGKVYRLPVNLPVTCPNRAAGGGNAALSQASRRVIGKCPRCGRDVVEGKKSFFCEAWRDTPPCGFALWKNDRFFSDKRKALTPKIAAALLKDGRVRLKNLFSEKKGVMYDATVILDDGGGKFVHYKMEFDNTKSTNRKGKGI